MGTSVYVTRDRKNVQAVKLVRAWWSWWLIDFIYYLLSLFFPSGLPKNQKIYQIDSESLFYMDNRDGPKISGIIPLTSLLSTTSLFIIRKRFIFRSVVGTPKNHLTCVCETNVNKTIEGRRLRALYVCVYVCVY